MIKVLGKLFGNTAPAQPVKKRPPVARRETSGGGVYRAVSLAPSLMCCAEATRTTGKPLLVAEAPHLPLKKCTMPKSCNCKFRKLPDRRDGDRRLFGETETSRWFAGIERRHGMARRTLAAR
jgi:hypothetical protein